MEYQKIINLLDNTPNQPTEFRTVCVEIEIHVERITPIVKMNFKLQC